MSNAIERNNTDLVKQLFDNEFDPNSFIDGLTLIELYIMLNNKRYNFNMINLLLSNLKDINMFRGEDSLITNILYFYKKGYTDDNHFLELIRLFIEAGTDFNLKYKDNEYHINALEFLEEHSKRFNKTLHKNIIELIKQEIPEQYKKFMNYKKMLSNVDKYNL